MERKDRMGPAGEMAGTLLKRRSLLLFMGRVLGGSFEVMTESSSSGGQQEGRLLSALAAPAGNFSRMQPRDPAEELQTTTARQMSVFGVAGAYGEHSGAACLKTVTSVGAKYPQPAQGQQLVVPVQGSLSPVPAGSHSPGLHPCPNPEPLLHGKHSL